jgi:hypothetical protein
VTEAEWNQCADPDPMLEFLARKVDQQAVRVLILTFNFSATLRQFERKLRLFVTHCCRQVWDKLDDDRSRRAIQVAEQLAEGRATRAELRQAHRGAHQVSCERIANADWSATAAEMASRPSAVENAKWVIYHLSGNWEWGGHRESHRKRYAHLLRCTFGPLPFRQAPVEPSWRTFTVKHLAEAIYDDRAFDRMPILADALEDAGCTNQEVLAHCRGGGEHVRGCWVVDLLLGKSGVARA